MWLDATTLLSTHSPSVSSPRTASAGNGACHVRIRAETPLVAAVGDVLKLPGYEMTIVARHDCAPLAPISETLRITHILSAQKKARLPLRAFS